ncbi:hypothetical protein ACFSTE_14925 [Aquimarina hainanensis]|uniref:Uncharacterized protein n=1 Tax=Aquimarina hainanensis TaxID=1578017 RepID=A0ABW5N926_9FLAO
MKHYYKPSGKFSILSILYFLILSVTAFPILGVIYAYCIRYIPFVYINFLIAAGFGFGLGLLINIVVINKGKNRNPGVSAVLGTLGGAVALYVHWAVWVQLVIADGTPDAGMGQLFTLVTDPGMLGEWIAKINEVGTWGIRNNAVHGTFLSVIWGIEALIVIGISTLISFPRAKQPFCEQDGVWFEETVLPTLNYIGDAPKMVAELEKGTVTAFDEISLAATEEKDHSVITVYASKRGDCYVTVLNKKAKITDKGKIEHTDEAVVSYIRLNQSLKEQLLKFQSHTTTS